MKKLLYFFLIVIMIFTLTNCSKKENTTTEQVVNIENKESQNSSNKEKTDSSENEITVIWFQTTPHTFIDKESGKITGPIYNLLEEIGSNINVNFKWMKETTPVPRQLELLESSENKYVGAIIVKNAEREKFGIFSEKNFFSSQTALALKKDNPLTSISKVEDILNINIGYAKSTFLSPFMKDERINFDLVSSGDFMKTNFQKLVLDRIDAVYAPDKAGLLLQTKNNNLENDVKILDLPENKAPFHFLFSKSSNEIAEKFNNYIKDIDLEKMYLDYLAEYIDISKI